MYVSIFFNKTKKKQWVKVIYDGFQHSKDLLALATSSFHTDPSLLTSNRMGRGGAMVKSGHSQFLQMTSSSTTILTGLLFRVQKRSLQKKSREGDVARGGGDRCLFRHPVWCAHAQRRGEVHLGRLQERLVMASNRVCTRLY